MKDKLVKNFVIGTFVSLYALVSVISTIHVIDFFELSNPRWLAVTLAIGFEIGAAASLASLVILDKMNKTVVWALFIAITLMQMQGNMYYAFVNLNDYESWSELFNLIEEDVIDQKRFLSFVSGAILPLIALGFIKSLVDYIKPEGEDESQTISSGSMDDDLFNEDFETKPSEEFFEDILDKPVSPKTGVASDVSLDTSARDKWNELADQLADQSYETDELLHQEFETDELFGGLEKEESEQFDEDHSLDQVLNKMVDDLTEEEVEEIIPVIEHAVESPQDSNIDDTETEADRIGTFPNETNHTSVAAVVQDIIENDVNEIELDTEPEFIPKPPLGDNPNPKPVNLSPTESIVQKMDTPHLPENKLSEDDLWKQAMDKKAKEDMEAFIKKKNANR
ncbi:hypothetical protein OAE73_00080 [bacterium]|nr:hypothetical protein [bacterium]